MPTEPITVSTVVNAPIETVWACWNEPQHIDGWCFADPSWEAKAGTNDLRVGGQFTTRMQARDGSMGFDFGGTYDAVEPHSLIAYTLGSTETADGTADAGRKVRIEFEQTPEGVRVTETFDPENVYPREMQQAGWQAILDNFKRYTESR
jgi:uncharacterized protein YndB with AHSA1/START domain